MVVQDIPSIVLHVDADDDRVDDEALWAWLANEGELQGHVKRQRATPAPGRMSVTAEIVIAVLSTGIVGLVGRSIAMWVKQSRCDVSLTMTAPDGRSVRVSGERLRDPAEFLRAVESCVGLTAAEGVRELE